jgi:hypothetical protein
MKKLERILAEGDVEAPTKHYVNMNLNGSIKDPAAGVEVSGMEAQGGIEGLDGRQIGASDSLPALSSQKKLGQKKL